MIKTVNATRYVTPLREGGSLPAVVEADDGEQYVMKFVGAGQGVKALIAELVAGEIARLLGFLVPTLVLINMDESLGRSEPDPEIQHILQSSIGLNLGMRYLPSALPFNPLLQPTPATDLASAVVWFDAFVTNVDRTPRNVNMLCWEDNLWLIDHGASLYFHHNWTDYLDRSRTPFSLIQQHSLLPFAGDIREADNRLRPQLTHAALSSIIGLIPDGWLGPEEIFADAQAHREAYVTYLIERLAAADNFVTEAVNAYNQLI